MGECFAGPKTAKYMNSGWTVVGPLVQWKLTITLGLNLAGGVESN